MPKPTRAFEVSEEQKRSLLHLINYIDGRIISTTAPQHLAWILKHPRIQVHFTPTGSSWMNRVERFFRHLTDDVVREGGFSSVAELVSSINVHLAHHNLNPKPYRWKAKGEDILRKIQRAREIQASHLK